MDGKKSQDVFRREMKAMAWGGVGNNSNLSLRDFARVTGHAAP